MTNLFYLHGCIRQQNRRREMALMEVKDISKPKISLRKKVVLII